MATSPDHPTGTREEWLSARRTLLEREKELTRLSDELARERQELPWVRIDEPYAFCTPEGSKTLPDLFEGRSQLIVYHFMLGPGWGEGCVGCSLSADHFDGPMRHLNEHDVTMIAVSRAPVPEIEAYRRRMGWDFTWVSSGACDFNYDFGVSFTDEQRAAGVDYNFEPIGDPGTDELPGMSTFVIEDGVVYHTYSSFARGGDVLIGMYQLLDRAPKGRNEGGFTYHPMEWVRRHDEYAQAGVGA